MKLLLFPFLLLLFSQTLGQDGCIDEVSNKYIYENGVGNDHTDNDCDTNTDIVHLVDHDYPSQFPDGTKCSGPPKSFPDPEDCQMFYYCYRGCVTHSKVENIVCTICDKGIDKRTLERCQHNINA